MSGSENQPNPSQMSTQCRSHRTWISSDTSSSSDDDEVATRDSPSVRPSLSVRIGPFDVPVLSPASTPNHPRRQLAGSQRAEVTEMHNLLLGSSSAIAEALERSGESVNRSFVARWVDKRSQNLLAELEAHAAWRTAFVSDSSGYGIREERIEELLDAGVIHFQGNATSGHPLLIFSASRYDASKFSSKLPACLVYTMDAALKCADESVNPKRQVVWLFDLNNVSRKNCSIEFLESVFEVFQKHYPECLDRLYFVNAPFLFWGLWTVASVFVDVKTREKIVFCRSKDLIDVSSDVLPEAYGGQAKLRSLRRAVALIRQGHRAIPDDSDDDEQEIKAPMFHLLKSTVFWLLFSTCFVAWVAMKVFEYSG